MANMLLAFVAPAMPIPRLQIQPSPAKNILKVQEQAGPIYQKMRWWGRQAWLDRELWLELGKKKSF